MIHLAIQILTAAAAVLAVALQTEMGQVLAWHHQVANKCPNVRCGVIL